MCISKRSLDPALCFDVAQLVSSERLKTNKMSVMLVIIVIFPTLASGSIASQVAKRRETVPNWAPDFNMHHDSISIEEDLGPTLLMEESEEDIPPAAVRDKVLVGHHRSPRNDQPLPRDKPTQVVVSYALYVFNAIP